MKKLFPTLAILVLYLTNCTSTKNFTGSELAAYEQSMRFARHIWDDKKVQDEYMSYSPDPVSKLKLEKYYEGFENCRARRVSFMESKKSAPELLTFLYRVKLSCGEKVFGITYKNEGDKLTPYSIRTIAYSEYPTDPVFNPS